MTGVGVWHASHLIHLDGQTGGGVGRQVDTKLIRPRNRTKTYFIILKAVVNIF